MPQKIRSRYAPSPTGDMHIGNLRSALYEYLVAKHNGGTFILRIEDTDQNRYVEGATEQVYKILRQTGLIHDEGPDVGGDYGPYIQSERKGDYLPHAKNLIETGNAYYCFCTKERLESLKDYDRHCHQLSQNEIDTKLAAKEPFVVRQFIPEGKTTFRDEVYGNITIDHKEIEDQILIKSDGMPTYNFANVIDDHAMAITHVLRGSEYLTSTPKYKLLYEAFGWDIPTFVHLPLMLNASGGKISKRNGDEYASIQYLLDSGYLPSAIINYIAFLGWSSPENKEYYTLPELVEAFEIKNISKSPSNFDLQKLNWMNGEHIKRLPEDVFYEMALPTLQSTIKNPSINLKDIAKMVQSRVLFVKDAAELVDFIDELPHYDIELYTHKKMKTSTEVAQQALEAIMPIYQNLQKWDHDHLYTTAVKCGQNLAFKSSQILWPLRTAISGKPASPCGAPELCLLLGKEESIKRIKIGIDKLKRG